MNPTTTTITTSEHACTLLKGIVHLADIVFHDVAEILAELDLTQPQATLLWALEPSTPPVSMRELARILHCDPSNITLLGDQLQAAGLTERHPDPTDGRRRVLVLTDQGRAAWSRLLERMQQRSPLFTLTHEEQNQLLGLLEKVQTNITQIPTGFLT